MSVMPKRSMVSTAMLIADRGVSNRVLSRPKTASTGSDGTMAIRSPVSPRTVIVSSAPGTSSTDASAPCAASAGRTASNQAASAGAENVALRSPAPKDALPELALGPVQIAFDTGVHVKDQGLPAFRAIARPVR